jgi:hypothetical protein
MQKRTYENCYTYTHVTHDVEILIYDALLERA